MWWVRGEGGHGARQVRGPAHSLLLGDGRDRPDPGAHEADVGDAGVCGRENVSAGSVVGAGVRWVEIGEGLRVAGAVDEGVGDYRGVAQAGVVFAGVGGGENDGARGSDGGGECAGLDVTGELASSGGSMYWFPMRESMGSGFL